MIRDIEYRGYEIRSKAGKAHVYNIYKDGRFVGDEAYLKGAKAWVDAEIEDAAADAERHAAVRS